MAVATGDARLRRLPFGGIICSVYGCVHRASWMIGAPQGPLSINLRLCDDCAKAMLGDLPGELAPATLEGALAATPGATFINTGAVIRETVAAQQAQAADTAPTGTITDDPPVGEFPCDHPACTYVGDTAASLRGHKLKHAKEAKAVGQG